MIISNPINNIEKVYKTNIYNFETERELIFSYICEMFVYDSKKRIDENVTNDNNVIVINENENVVILNIQLIFVMLIFCCRY